MGVGGYVGWREVDSCLCVSVLTSKYRTLRLESFVLYFRDLPNEDFTAGRATDNGEVGQLPTYMAFFVGPLMTVY